jgi:hypothetical protein
MRGRSAHFDGEDLDVVFLAFPVSRVVVDGLELLFASGIADLLAELAQRGSAAGLSAAHVASGSAVVVDVELRTRSTSPPFHMVTSVP